MKNKNKKGRRKKCVSVSSKQVLRSLHIQTFHNIAYIFFYRRHKMKYQFMSINKLYSLYQSMCQNEWVSTSPFLFDWCDSINLLSQKQHNIKYTYWGLLSIYNHQIHSDAHYKFSWICIEYLNLVVTITAQLDYFQQIFMSNHQDYIELAVQNWRRSGQNEAPNLLTAQNFTMKGREWYVQIRHWSVPNQQLVLFTTEKKIHINKTRGIQTIFSRVVKKNPVKNAVCPKIARWIAKT